MESLIKGKFYNEIILEIVKPVIVADVSAAPYDAETFKLNGTIKEEQHPFVIAHPEAVTLRVVPFYTNEEITWSFPGGGPYPMPLKKIVNHVDNTVTANIQIGY